MSDFDNKPKKVSSILNSPKMRLSTQNPSVKGTWATLKWDLFKNNPRIVVDTGNPNLKNQDNDWGRITAALDPVIFGMYLEALEQAVTSPGEWKAKIENSNHAYANGQKDPNITVQNDLWVGKDKEGCVYTSVVSKKEGFDVIKFIFGPADRRFHKLYHGDGTEYTKSELSVLTAKAYLRMLSCVMPMVMVMNYEEPPKPQFGGNKGGGGGGNWNRGGGGGGNRNYGGGGGGAAREAAPVPATDDGDGDLPF